MKETEKALVTLLETGNVVANAIQDDGKVDFKESMAISIKAIGLIGIIKNLPKIKAEIKARKEEDIPALVELFKAKFDLKNDEAEEKVEQGLDVLLQLASMIFTPKAA
ncbi:MAG TPA: hypothetical protein VLQ91_00465 [Draconibacterium sp.]|nr:hypothetical protein [Draconibacterium sp.]